MLKVFSSLAIPSYLTMSRQSRDEVDLPHKLHNFLLEAFKPDPLHSYHLPNVPVERAIHSVKLSAPKYND